MGFQAKIIYIKYKLLKNTKFVGVEIVQREGNGVFSDTYDFDCTTEIEDQEKNVLVIPEFSGTHLLFDRYPKIQKIMWWLSVDNHFKSPSKKYKFHENNHVIYAYNAYYVRDFLFNNKVEKSCSLTTPISDIFFEEFDTQKEDIVLYNPRKGGESFAKILIKHSSDLKWVSLKGLSQQELVNLMRKSKVYVDFGAFPGRERMPREAVLSKCCLVLGLKGASRLFEDFPIPIEYKFKEEWFKGYDVQSILRKIRECINCYEEKKNDFSYFRRRILSSKQQFLIEVQELFSCPDS